MPPPRPPILGTASPSNGGSWLDSDTETSEEGTDADTGNRPGSLTAVGAQ